MKNTKGMITIILGAVACIMFFSAGNYLNKTGEKMERLISQSGTSLAEVYYQDVGDISKGLGKFCYAFGVGTLAISIGISGDINMTENKDNTIK